MKISRRVLVGAGLVTAGLLYTASMVAWRDEAHPSGQPAVFEVRTHPVRTSAASQRLAAEWRALLGECNGSTDPEALRKRLAKLKAGWLEEDDLHLVAQTAAQLLRSGEDAETGIPFKIGTGSSIRGWPSMRVFLLDVLAITDPDLASAVAREVLASTNSAEEYAVALKPLVESGTWKASDAELADHFSRLLSRDDWQGRAGFLEALDLSRVVSSPATTEALARWVDTSPQAASAGEMALHETAAQSPGLLVGLVSAEPTLFADQPDLRAGLMARAEISKEAQAVGVESYLKDTAVSSAEKEQFLALFPLRSATTGTRLYGSAPMPFERGKVAADDRAALEAVGRWKEDPALSTLLPSLEALEGRLEGWVRQAGD